MRGHRRVRLFWGIGIGVVVGLVSALLRWDTKTSGGVVLRMAVCGLVFGVLAWRLGDRFWRNPLWWVVAMALVAMILGFL
jgi:ABC-type multidrug transport system permease subunit